MENIFLHIGLPKTATTTIQNGLMQNSELLKEAGYLYPRSGRKSNAHHNLAFQVQDHYHYLFDKSVGTFEDLLEEIRENNFVNVILSSEAFINTTPGQIKRVYDYLSKFKEVQIIVYIRRPDAWINSHWSQQVKIGATTETPKEYINHMLRNRKYEKIFDWAKYFGINNMIIKVFEKDQLVDDHVFLDFLKNCGIKEYKKIQIPDSTNIAPSIKELEIIRYFYSYMDKNINIPTKTRYKIFNAFHSYGEETGWTSENKVNFITPKIYKKIMRHYKSSSIKVARTFFNRDELFLEPYVEKGITKYDLSELEGKEALELFAWICIHVLKNRPEKIENEAVIRHRNIPNKNRIKAFISKIKKK